MQKIMFNDKFGLTKAVLEGRKTMTRRFPNKEWKDIMPGLVGQDLSKANTPFKVGEVVAVAQAYKDIMPELDFIWKGTAAWSNKMFVQASQMHYHIRITDVRVERMQDISDEDCIREGIYKDNPRPGFYFNGYAFELSENQHGDILASQWFKTPREAFAALIDKVSGKGTWASNPWVFVYEFELVK